MNKLIKYDTLHYSLNTIHYISGTVGIPLRGDYERRGEGGGEGGGGRVQYLSTPPRQRECCQ